tara:strand:+ start:860 stop:1633 length:774 start_codon:yes stop_codon:yes gene_type:complete
MYNLLIFLFVLIYSCSPREEQKPLVYARVGNEELNQKNISVPSFPNRPNYDGLSFYINSWVDETILFISAKRTGLLKDASLVKKRDAFYKSLIVSSFVENETSKRIKITNEEIKDYYKENSVDFIRNNDVVFAEQYILNDKDSANILLSLILSDKQKKINQFTHQLESGYIKEGIFSPNVDFQIFKKNNKIVGPIKSKGLYYILNILSKHKKGSLRGLEEVYDEIYQRIYKGKQSIEYVFLMDSLKKSVGFYINKDF